MCAAVERKGTLVRAARMMIALLLVFPVVLVVAGVSRAGTAEREAKFRKLTNAERLERDVRWLRERTRLSRIARRHSRRMARRGEIFHHRDLGSKLDGWREIGEIVGRGLRVRPIHERFMDSAPHREQILYRPYDSIGVGTARRGGRIYVTEIFVNY
jgi:uncharacterized protein YkwD